MILITLLQALWASSIPLSKIMLTMSPPIFLAGLRMFAAGALLLAYQWYASSARIRFEWKHVSYYVQIIFFGVYLKYILRYWGLAQLSSVKMAFMLNLTPFCVALFSYLAFKETLSQRQWWGLCLGFIGLLPIVCIRTPTEQFFGELSFFSLAELAILAEIAAHSYGLIVARKMIRECGYSPALANGIRMFGGGAFALLTSCIVEANSPVTHTLQLSGLLMLIIISSNIICHNLYFYLLKSYSATFLSLSDFLSPLCAAIYGWFFLHETITWYYALSSSIVLLGLYLFYQDEIRKDVTQPSFVPGIVYKYREKLWPRANDSEIKEL